ncbi:TPA: excinuclease ABC subunit B [Candidatus Dependentiae bacterium]|nr:MAG: UvrABC system protein B [candidate division TM6 bacterium GW2011_GWF2_43_87]HBL98019.1 excinuclease ABC subunit B [Candidatus Dependentiae bacterium]
MSLFKLHAPFPPAGDQIQAIEMLASGRPGLSTLLGVTGSGKTYSIAQVIARQSKPVLVLSPNKTLAAQLYEEFSLFFPENKVCYFVSYYDYYQPESYLPAQDIYIAKETQINSEIERLRIEASASIINRPDTIVIASVSCIYSLGNPTEYRNLAFPLKRGQTISRAELIRQLIFIQYVRNDMEKASGTMQVYGPTIEVQLPYQREKLRIELDGNTIESLLWVHKQTGAVERELEDVLIFPAKHFVTTQERKNAALKSIQAELDSYAPTMENQLYRERLKARVGNDLELIDQVGFCSGIENYSVHFDGRNSGEPPYCLFDFFEDFLLVIDESHIAIPQLRGMYAGDAARKKSLIDFGFRLPSAKDNRPLQFTEIERFFKDVIFVSATPGDYELSKSELVAEQIIRPTGLVDPLIEIHKREGQIDHLISEIKKAASKGFRTLVTVLTKKQAEELARFLEGRGIKVCYLHHDLKTPQRTELLHKLRNGIFDCLVGVNLLREGLDLPEVALVAIMDADIESFLRDKRSLIQTIGRAARNAEAKVIFFADRITKSMQGALDETERRRNLQIAFNTEHGIVPRSVTRDVTKSISKLQEAIASAQKGRAKQRNESPKTDLDALIKRVASLEEQMQEAAAQFNFEKAIELRKEWMELQAQLRA